ncbi:MAG: VOC family protein [Gammaproteobacteria bacterium]
MPALNFMHVNLHVTDLERSIAFYERLGFRIHYEGDRREAATMPEFELNDRLEYGGGRHRAVLMSLGDHPRATTLLCLTQFVDPPATPKPFKPRHEAGTHRIAFRVKDLDGMLAGLRAAGVDIRDPVVESEAPGLARGLRMRWTLFPDPDSNLLELMEFVPAA